MSEPLKHLVDESSFERAGDDLRTRDPLGWPDYLATMEVVRGKTDVDESVVAGAATIGGHPVEVAAFDFSFFGGSMGEVAGERIARAMERARRRAVPFILRTATGGARMQEGMRSLAQMPKLVCARAELADASVPYVSVLAHPATGGVLASIGGLADVTIAEEGATVGFAGPRLVYRFTGRLPSGSHTAATALAAGLVDTMVPGEVVGRTVAHVLDVLAPDTPEEMAEPVVDLQTKVPSDGWEAVEAVRAEDRPTGPQLLRESLDAHVVLQGDRSGREDPALVCALGRLCGRRLLMMALDRAFRPGPSAYRKALRCVEIAERLGLPVVALVDTRGAHPAETSENAGIAWAIADLMQAMLSVSVPVVSIVTGEGASGGALAFATGDLLLAYSDSVFSVIIPESAAEILWRDESRSREAARLLKPTALDLVGLGIADGLIAEPLGADSMRRHVAYHLARLSNAGPGLVGARRNRWRGVWGE